MDAQDAANSVGESPRECVRGWAVDKAGHRVVRIGIAELTERRTVTMADDLRMA